MRATFLCLHASVVVTETTAQLRRSRDRSLSINSAQLYRRRAPMKAIPVRNRSPVYIQLEVDRQLVYVQA